MNDDLDDHVARLQAEVVDLRAEVRIQIALKRREREMKTLARTERDALQSELTKALSELDLVKNEDLKFKCLREQEGEIKTLQSELTKATVWERFADYLLDNCEGKEIYEERLQYWLSEMLAKEAHQSAPAAKEGEA